MTQAKLLIAPGCPHCSTMMNILGELLKEGRIGRLVMINIAEQPDAAAKYNVRSVPWLKIGEMEFSGAHSRAELDHAIEMAVSEDGQQRFLFEQLKNGRLDEVIELVQRDRERLPDVIALLHGSEVPMTVQIGVSAILESFADDPSALSGVLPELLELSRSENEAMRTDACHFLSLVDDDAARERLQQCIDDSSATVREVARDGLEGQA